MCFQSQSSTILQTILVIFLSKELVTIESVINPLSANFTNGQTHSNNSSAVADKLFECVRLFCGIGGLKFKNELKHLVQWLRGNELIK